MATTHENGLSWTKVIAIIGGIVLPLLSIAGMGMVWAVRIDDKVNNVILHQQEQGGQIKDLNDRVSGIAVVVDTISRRQENYKRDMNYKFKELEYKHK